MSNRTVKGIALLGPETIRATCLTLNDDKGKLAVRVHMDGTVEMAEHLNVQAVARQFWEAVSGIAREQQMRINALSKENIELRHQQMQARGPISLDAYQAKYKDIITLNEDMRYGYECCLSETTTRGT